MRGKAKAIIPRTVPLWPDAGRMLGYGRATSYKKAQRGEIPTLPISGKQLVPTDWLERVLSADSY